MINIPIPTIVLISYASKVMLKILQARLQQYVNQEHPDVHSPSKEYTNYHTIALISRTGKFMLKILQARLQQYVN